MVFRTQKNKNYTTMSNYHLRDNELSLKAKGLLSQILSLPDEWTYTIAGLVVKLLGRIAEIGDISRFHRRENLTAFAGVDPGANQSGQYEAQSVHTSKHGSPRLRKTLFQIMDCLVRTKPYDDPVYRFIDKKRSEGKPYFVYMTAGANKFLRIYYGRVKEYLASITETE